MFINLSKKNIYIFPILFLFALSIFTSGCSTSSNAQNVEWGRSEAKEIDLTSKIPGRVVSLYVKEGDTVEKGQVIARIDTRDLEAQLNQNLANISAIQAQQNQASTVTKLNDAVSNSNVDTASAGLSKASADLTMAENDFLRFQELLNSGAVSQQVFDSYQTKYQVAQSNYKQAETALAAAKARLLQVDVDTANEKNIASKIEQANAAIEQIKIALDEAEIKAPFSGIITAKYIEEGSIISQGMPVVAIQDPLDNWVNIKVPETELNRYKLNQTISLIGRNEDLKINGTIIDISKKPEFATYRGSDERNNTDIVTFNVKIQVNSPDIRPGMRFKLAGSENN
ncbi:HlyD family efflux transporter periplasmic adaptor subunit [Anaerosinus sp.]